MIKNIFKDKKGQLKKLSIIFGLLIIFTMFFVLAQDSFTFGTGGTFEFTPPTPINGTITTNASISNINISIYAPQKISKITFFNNFNESMVLTNYSWYDEHLKFFSNLDNNSLIGDNSSYIVDLSPTGSNATIIGNGNRTFVAGKYGQAYSSNSSTIGYISLNYTEVIPNATEEMTFCAWLNMTTNSATLSNYQGIYIFSSSGNPWKRVFYLYNSSTPYFGFEFWNASTSTGPSGVLPLGQWIHLCVAFNNQTIDLYINGKYNKSSNTLSGSTNTSFLYNTNRLGAMGSTTQFSNGLIDDPMIFDKKESASTILSIYNSQLTEHSPDNYTFEVFNQLTPLTSGGSFEYKYGLCIANSLMEENCSTNQIFTRIPRNANISSNFSNQTGTIRTNFYGLGLQGTKTGNIDTNCDGVSETPRNQTWFHNTVLDSGGTIAYYDASLHAYYQVYSNFGFEDWGNSSVIWLNSNKTIYPLGMWQLESYRDGGGWIYKTNDSHSGSYATQMNVTTGTSLILNKLNGFSLETGKTYTASIWVKGNGTVYIGWLYSGIGMNYTNKVLNETWQEVKLSITPNSSQTSSWRWTVDTNGGNDTVTIDDFNFTENGIEKHWRFTGNLTNFQNEFTWNYEHNITSIAIMDYMISELANRGSKCVDSINDTDTQDCMPTEGDLHIYHEVAIDWYQRVDQYRNISYIQIWNEPDGGFFEDNLAGQSAKTDFVILFNDTYVAFNNYNPNITIAGFRGTSATVTNTSLPAFTQMMLSNLSSQFKIYSYNPYSSYYSNNPTSSEIAYLLSQCAVYGAECSWIMATEWQPTFSGKNASYGQSNRYKLETAMQIVDILNHYPNIISEFPYHWDDSTSYFNCPNRYNEYPSFWSSVSEAGLDNLTPTYYPPYTVVQKFSKLCEVNGGVFNSTVQDNIWMTSCNKNGKYSAIIGNIGNESLNISSYVLESYPYNNITNYETGEVYIISAGVTDLGVLNAYTPLYLSSGVPPTITDLTPLNNTNTNNPVVNFTANLTDDVGLNNATLNVYNSSGNLVNQSFITYVAGEISTIVSWVVNFTGLDDVYTWFISLFDDEGKNTISNNQTFIIDTTNPNINIAYPIAGTNYSINVTNLNYTVSDLYLNSCWYSTNGGASNSTSVSLGTNFTGVINIEGTNQWIVYCNDSAGNVGYSTVTFLVDLATKPNIELVDPTTAVGNYTNKSDIYVNITASDSSNFSIINNLGLELWLRFNNETGENNTYVKDYSPNNLYANAYNGTNYTTSGKLGGAFKFDGVNDYMVVSNSNGLNITNGITVSAWIKLDSFSSYRRIIVKSPSTDVYPYTTYGLLTDSGNKVRMEFSSGGYQHIIKSTTNLSNGVWYLVTGTWNGSDDSAKLYINGDLDNSTLYRSFSNGTLAIVSNIFNGKIDTNNNQISIGAQYKSSTSNAINLINATIDDPFILSRGTDIEEILAYYNGTRFDHNLTNLADDTYNLTAYSQDINGNVNQSLSRLITLDNTAPIITFAYPLNTSYNYNVTAINYTFSDLLPDKCWYSRDGGATNLTFVNAGINFTVVTSVEGSNTYTIYCNDTFNHIGSQSITFFKDDINPSIQVLFPSEGISTISSSFEILYNVSDTNSINNCSLIIDGINTGTDATIIKNANQTISTIFSVGTHIYSVDCYDYYANLGTSGNRTIEIKTGSGGNSGGSTSSSGTQQNSSGTNLNSTSVGTNQTSTNTTLPSNTSVVTTDEFWSRENFDSMFKNFAIYMKEKFFKGGAFYILLIAVCIIVIIKVASNNKKGIRRERGGNWR